MSHEKKVIAFFDFDGTLTKKDTLMPFLMYVVGRKRFCLKMILLLPIIMLYFCKIIRNDLAKEVVLKFFLKGYESEILEKYGRFFSLKVLPSLLREEGMEKLREHQNKGHRCIIVSASLDVYLKYWGESESLDCVISSSLRKDDSGVITGDLDGPNCYGDEKVNCIKRTIPDLDCFFKFGYGDSRSDIPLLSLCDCGFILNKNFSKSSVHFDKVKYD